MQRMRRAADRVTMWRSVCAHAKRSLKSFVECMLLFNASFCMHYAGTAKMTICLYFHFFFFTTVQWRALRQQQQQQHTRHS